MPPPRRRVDRPLAERTQEGGVIRHPETDAASRHDADVRPERGERFRDRRIDAAVHEPEWLGDVSLDRNVRTNELFTGFIDLEAVVTIEG